MNEKKLITIISSIVIIIIIGIIILYAYSLKTPQPQLETFTVDPVQGFMATSKRLSSVEIWIVPTGTNVTEEDHQQLGTMILTSNNPDNQLWTFSIPKEPIVATEIYAKGFDDEEREINRISLPYTGASQIYMALWGTTTPATTTSVKGK